MGFRAKRNQRLGNLLRSLGAMLRDLIMSGMKEFYFNYHYRDGDRATQCPQCDHPMRDGYCYYCGTGKRPAGKSAERRDEDEANARRLWDETLPIAGTLAAHYLHHHRFIEVMPPAVDEVQRFHPQCRIGGNAMPALFALLRSVVDGHACGVHRTPIDRQLGKIHSPWTLGTLGRAAVMLWPAPVAGRLTVGEGVETVLSAVQLMPELAPAWALGAANNLGNFPILAAVTELHILVDNDANRVGQRHAMQCAARYRAGGKRVYTHTPKQHKDFNDILRERRHG